jgi:hypothetical protein
MAQHGQGQLANNTREQTMTDQQPHNYVTDMSIAEHGKVRSLWHEVESIDGSVARTVCGLAYSYPTQGTAFGYWSAVKPSMDKLKCGRECFQGRYAGAI